MAPGELENVAATMLHRPETPTESQTHDPLRISNK